MEAMAHKPNRKRPHRRVPKSSSTHARQQAAAKRGPKPTRQPDAAIPDADEIAAVLAGGLAGDPRHGPPSPPRPSPSDLANRVVDEWDIPSALMYQTEHFDPDGAYEVGAGFPTPAGATLDHRQKRPPVPGWLMSGVDAQSADWQTVSAPEPDDAAAAVEPVTAWERTRRVGGFVGLLADTGSGYLALVADDSKVVAYLTPVHACDGKLDTAGGAGALWDDHDAAKESLLRLLVENASGQQLHRPAVWFYGQHVPIAFFDGPVRHAVYSIEGDTVNVKIELPA